jgi:hypothetical protein
VPTVALAALNECRPSIFSRDQSLVPYGDCTQVWLSLPKLVLAAPLLNGILGGKFMVSISNLFFESL